MGEEERREVRSQVPPSRVVVKWRQLTQQQEASQAGVAGGDRRRRRQERRKQAGEEGEGAISTRRRSDHQFP